MRFVAGGVANTAFSYGVYLLLQFVMDYQLAYLVAYAAGIVFAYWFNARHVFRVPLSWRGLFAYPLVYVVQYGLSALLLHVLVERLGAAPAWAPLPVTVAMLPLTYAMNRLVLTFKGSRT
ncbi:GtrA family protein [Massilia sp. RP-1-19]|uniref:GtrA family protein n=1 Tax=Massilia polaris TaxID=2728846 RepID=A0A848HNK9_9BURK|nr:GtrA family protein [Massilia polaris]NML62587.1 GtrA family protein [Massilia polaris]